jgi:hypothetical protein
VGRDCWSRIDLVFFSGSLEFQKPIQDVGGAMRSLSIRRLESYVEGTCGPQAVSAAVIADWYTGIGAALRALAILDKQTAGEVAVEISVEIDKLLNTNLK